MSAEDKIVPDENEGEPTPDAPGVSASAAKSGRKTVYVKHPVNPSVKKKAMRMNLRILDSKFAPPGATILDGATGEKMDGRPAKLKLRGKKGQDAE